MAKAYAHLTLRKPARATGNAGMPTPYEQGRAMALRGDSFEQVYDQPGELVEAKDFAAGFAAGRKDLGRSRPVRS